MADRDSDPDPSTRTSSLIGDTRPTDLATPAEAGTRSQRRPWSRRRLFGIGAVGLGLAAAAVAVPRALNAPRPVSPTGAAVAAAEAARRRSGATVTRTLRAAPTTVDLGGRQVRTWAYDGAVPAPPIRVSAGDELRVSLANDLPDPTTVHWHGLALRNDMDGVPGLTMAAVAPGKAFDYTFTVPHPGTYWFHPHVGVQLDTGLYAPLIVDDPAEPGRYDEEAVLVLDDWTDGWAASPTAILDAARRNGMGGMGDTKGAGGMAGMGGMGGTASTSGMAGMGMATPGQPLGSDTGDVAYPAHLINGRLPSDPITITSRPGRRIRLRVINAAADTPYRFAVGGHELTVTHTDGLPVQPVVVDTLLIGMGERYDVVLTTGDGVFPVVAVAEGKDDPAGLAVLHTGPGATPAAGTRPVELTGRLLDYTQLRATPDVQLGPVTPDRTVQMSLTMADGGRQWLINGRSYADHEPLEVASGERVRVVLSNQSMMFHPMHVHGHTFALSRPDGTGPRKDTVNVVPMRELAIDLHADNPGQWLVHCHNAYHGELGMMSTLSYQR